MTADPTIRGIRPDDWEAIVELEANAYTALGLSEGRTALQSRVRASPATCFVLEHGANRRRRVAGYLLALPYPRFRYPGLDQPERTAFRSPNLHLHDLVVAEELRRCGLAGRLLRRLETVARAREHRHVSLVAVAGTDAFWSRHGFAPHREVAAPEHYGARAVYMSKPLGVPPHGSPSQHEGD
ncbi:MULTISPECIES: GNAT family N-acetyltransferase [Streptacidiphilus]|uniref:GNAT family N-acetyltransferase n=1 Tax=Streptacidiphilus cavernicola TaxID=3342716 RepID=A0ABV6UF19_9ACTN|nr:GNAT family N-acetyltransferase [Streptacidiphilus jeojiense]